MHYLFFQSRRKLSGNNGAGAEGQLKSTLNEYTTLNGVPVKAQLLWYEVWGSDKTYPNFAAKWAWAMSAPCIIDFIAVL